MIGIQILEIIGGYQVSVSKVKVSSPLGEIKYQLLAGEEIIYDSKERMYRQYIVFDQEGSEISNNSDYSGTAVFCLAREVNGLTIYHVTDKYVLAFQNVSIGEAFVIEDSIFSFSSLVKPGVFEKCGIITFFLMIEMMKKFQYISMLSNCFLKVIVQQKSLK